MFVVVVDHLLGVDMVVVAAVVAGALTVTVPVAGHGNGAGGWRNDLSLGFRSLPTAAPPQRQPLGPPILTYTQELAGGYARVMILDSPIGTGSRRPGQHTPRPGSAAKWGTPVGVDARRSSPREAFLWNC